MGKMKRAGMVIVSLLAWAAIGCGGGGGGSSPTSPTTQTSVVTNTVLSKPTFTSSTYTYKEDQTGYGSSFTVTYSVSAPAGTAYKVRVRLDGSLAGGQPSGAMVKEINTSSYTGPITNQTITSPVGNLRFLSVGTYYMYVEAYTTATDAPTFEPTVKSDWVTFTITQ